ncbi:MAG: LAO/AO transport system kinase [Halioglobus sp.]|jgi:LAO/AO transport system kinase
MSPSELPNPADLAAAVCRSERPSIAAALNLLDDKRDSSRHVAADFLTRLQRSNELTPSHLIGITGPPGAGKSSLTAALISHWRKEGLTVGVLAVDPSSPISGGALLGDRLRMKTSSEDDGVFVRSLACRGEFGGLSAEVWPMSVVMMAAFDITLIETVGVGQREIDVSQLCDTTCYVAQPGSGDSVQFLKAGILEVPHILVVNKEDMGEVAMRTLAELASALCKEHPDGVWQVPVLSASATRNSGIAALATKLQEHYLHLMSHNILSERRLAYQAAWASKRLHREFGSHGIDQLGGEQTLLNQLKGSELPILEQHKLLRQQLLGNPKTPL